MFCRCVVMVLNSSLSIHHCSEALLILQALKTQCIYTFIIIIIILLLLWLINIQYQDNYLFCACDVKLFYLWLYCEKCCLILMAWGRVLVFQTMLQPGICGSKQTLRGEAREQGLFACYNYSAYRLDNFICHNYGYGASMTMVIRVVCPEVVPSSGSNSVHF